ncbi:MAG: ABC transporter ATP-binding protein [Deltaproteobacteria bacterium]|nr:MAG: ABC transporter ATP-binding protein [Deltaproteobacteria bacterium]
MTPAAARRRCGRAAARRRCGRARYNAAVLQIDGVTFAYRSAPVLAGASLAVRPGEIACVVGANGAGKSTLLRLAAGLLRPAAGQVRAFGLDPASTPRPALARRLSLLPQQVRHTFPFSVAEVVLMGRYPHQRRGLLALESADDVAAADDAMRRCDVLHLAGRRFDELSGGERRRVLLAQSFCQRAELLLLDEPTASLDPAHALAVFAALRAEVRARAAAAVVVTHDLNLAARFADRVAVVHRARVVADGAPADVLAGPEAREAFGCPLYVGTLPDSGSPFVVPA